MPIQNIPIPSYLEPPTQEEQAQLALKRDQMQQAQADKIAKTIQSRVAMEKLIGDARVNQAGGMDPQEAQQSALFANAPNLFPNNPEKVTQLQDTILQRQKFSQAKRDYQAAFDSDVKNGMPPEAAFSKNWSKYAPDLIPQSSLGSSMSSIYKTDQTAQTADKKLGMDANKFQQAQDLKKTLMGLKTDQTDAALEEKQYEFDQNLALKKDKAGAGVNPIKPTVEVINGVKVMYVPGSKNVHVIQEDSNLRTFLLKNLPALIKSTGMSKDEAEKQLKAIWESANKAGAEEAAKAPPTEPTTSTGKIRKYNPTTGQLE